MGEKAIKFFDDVGQAGLIIIDLNLPRVSGHEVLEFLKEQGNKQDHSSDRSDRLRL